MPRGPYRDWDLLDPEVDRLLGEGRTLSEAARELGIPERTLRWHAHKRRGEDHAFDDLLRTGRAREQRENREKPLEEQVQGEIPVVEGDLEDPKIQALLAKGQVNLKEWAPKRAVVNQWGQSIQAKVWLDYVGNIVTPEMYRESLIEGAREVAADLQNFLALGVNQAAVERTGYMIEVSPFDIHIGKLGWGEEVGESYDSSIAIERAKHAVKDLTQRAVSGHRPELFLWTIGNDLMHADTPEGTTRAGTRMDLDTRFLKMFRAAWQYNAWAVAYLAQFAPVKVIVIPGNHDLISAFQVGEVLSALFEGNPAVTVDNRAAIRKYVEWGKVLLGFTHGDQEYHKDLPLIMADEVGEAWGRAVFREWHIGHIHNKRQTKWLTHDQHRTIGVRILPSLTGQDYWHYKKGYRHIPQAEAWIWHKEEGNVCSLTCATPQDIEARLGVER